MPASRRLLTPRSAAGGNPTTVALMSCGLHPERHGVYGRRSPARISCRLTTTYAGFATSCVAEELHKRGLAPDEVGPSLAGEACCLRGT